MDAVDWTLIAAAMAVAGSLRLAMHFSFTRRWRTAVERGDVKRLRKMLKKAKQELPPNLHALLAVELLRIEEKWAEMRAMVESEPLDRYDHEAVVTMENALAWSLLMLGEHERGRELADRLPTGEAVELTRAVGRLLERRAHEALPLLERLTPLPGPPRERAERAYFLGEALRAIGRPDAAAAYQRARDVEPRGPYAARADARRNAAAYR